MSSNPPLPTLTPYSFAIKSTYECDSGPVQKLIPSEPSHILF